MERMRSFSEYLNEVFDKPYRFEGPKEYPLYGKFSRYVYKFKAGQDNMKVEINKQGDRVNVTFYREGRTDKVGWGDQYRIFATVMEILADFAERYRPKEVEFMAELEDGTQYKMKSRGANLYFPDPDDPLNKMGMDNKNSRFRLYKKMVKRYARKMGYKSEVEVREDSPDEVFAHFVLTRVR